MFSKKKTECRVCGYRFTPERENIYTAEEPRSMADMLTKAPTRFSAVDCPVCGCQIALAIRAPRIDFPAIVERHDADAEETDGLSQSWDRGGAVFCNPPYGREIGKWVQKAFEEARGGYPIVLLIPARTDTAYFHDYIYGKAEIRFVRGRLRFTDDDGNAADPAPFPSMVVIYNGERVKE